MTSTSEGTASPFDAYGDGRYRQAVERSISFSGRDLDFFARAKVDRLLRVARLRFPDLDRRRLLDVGCGNGLTDALLQPHVGRLDGVDLSGELVADAVHNNPSGFYQVYDGSRLPFESASFDVAFAICVMHHVPPAAWDGFAAELMRVTHPRGLVVVFEHNPWNPLTRRAVRDCPFDEDAVLLPARRVELALTRSGGRAVRSRYLLFTPFEHPAVRAGERLFGRFPLGAQYVVTAEPGGRHGR